MQLKNINQLEVFLESLEIQGTEVLVGFRVDGQTQQLSLCRDVKNEPFYGSVYQNQTVEILRSALKSKDSVQFGVSGPWSPCLQSVKISKAQ